MSLWRGRSQACTNVSRAGLRFRLTLTYLVFFTIFSHLPRVSSFGRPCCSLYDSQLRNILNEEWAAVRGYLRIEKGKINWYYDRADPEEAIIVDRLQQIYLLTDQNGTVLQVSTKYEQLGIESPREIRETLRNKDPIWKTKTDSGKVQLPDSRRAAHRPKTTSRTSSRSDDPTTRAIDSSSSSRAITPSCCR